MTRKQIDVAPEALESFSGRLQGFWHGLNEASEMLDRELTVLGRSWEDAAFERFCASVRALERRMIEQSGDLDRFSRYLDTKAEEARQIHQREVD